MWLPSGCTAYRQANAGVPEFVPVEVAELREMRAPGIEPGTYD
jgi:hypothetical protein